MPNLFGTENFKTLGLNVLPILKNALRLPALVDNQYDAARVNMQEGSTISVKRPVVFTAKKFTSQIELQAINRRLVDIKLNTLTDISFELTVEEMTFIMNNDTKKATELLAPAFAALADDADERVAALWKDQIPFFTGDPAKAYDSVKAILNARKALVDRKTPSDQRKMALSTSAYAELLALDAFRDLDRTGTTAALLEASLGRKFGMEMFETQVDLTHEVGTGVVGAAGDVTLSADSVATVAADNQDVVNTEFNTLALTGLSATGTVAKGDLFSITQGGKTYQFVVKEEATAVAGAASIQAFPVYRDVTTQQPIVFTSGAILEFAGKTVGSFEKSVAFHPKAFAYVPVALPNASGLGVMQTVINAEGIAFRMTGAYNIETKKATYSVDMLAGFATLYPELAEVVIGG